MRIDERIATGAEPAFSFEFFPPKTDEGEANLAAALTALARLEPTFVSDTYGAGGTPAQRGKTIDIVSRIKADHGLEAMAHFTCVGATVDELRAVLDRMRDAGVEVETDIGTWQVVETPGHAPSHVCLHQPEQRLLISGDHLLGRVSQYFDIGYTPDPVGEFLHSLDVTEALDARLALAGHARPFTEVPGHIQANRDLIARNLDAVRGALGAGAKTAYEIARIVYGEQFTEELASWQMTMTTAWLTHLERLEEAGKTADDVEHWHLAAS
jgi:glyoxylase-like metal-dependent hydrolase (beta-lactamase superfamily II)